MKNVGRREQAMKLVDEAGERERKKGLMEMEDRS